MKKEYEDLSNFDFGFSFIDDEVEAVKQTADELANAVANNQAIVDDLTDRLNTMYNSIVPFLDNLCKNPDKSTIYWPDRVKKIEAYKKKLLSIVEGK
jgi:uncharacterized coiled-coil protein SlyX